MLRILTSYVVPFIIMQIIIFMLRNSFIISVTSWEVTIAASKDINDEEGFSHYAINTWSTMHTFCHTTRNYICSPLPILHYQHIWLLNHTFLLQYIPDVINISILHREGKKKCTVTFFQLNTKEIMKRTLKALRFTK